MNENLLTQTLNQLAEEGIPADLDLRTTIHHRLETSKSRPIKGVLPMKASFAPTPRRIAVWVTIIVLFVVAMFLLSPSGQSFAQSVLGYFTHAESDTQKSPWAPPSEGEYEEPIRGLSLEEAEELAGFSIHVPASLPPGYVLEDISYSSYRGIGVTQFFKYEQGFEFFLLNQSLSQWDEKVVGHSAVIETLSIGDTNVEYVSGDWDGSSGLVHWEFDAPVHTFRWKEDDFYFELQFFINDSWSPAYLSKEDMLMMVEVVMGLRQTFEKQVNFDYLTSVAEAQQVSDFDILEPMILPDGFGLRWAAYDREMQRVLLIYQSNSTTANLIITFSAQDMDRSWDGYPLAAVETVTVGDASGIFVVGSMRDDGVYLSNIGKSLYWETDDLQIEIYWSGTRLDPVQLEKEEMIAIAESMRPVSASSDFNCGSWGKPLCTLAEVQQRVDFPVEQFSENSELIFEGAYVDNETVLLRYNAVDLFQMPQEKWMGSQVVGASATIEEVQIGALRGEYVQGVWFGDGDAQFSEWQNEGMQSIIWQEDEIVFILHEYHEAVSKEQLLRWAAKLSEVAVSNETDLNHIRSIAETEALVGYSLKAFEPLPTGYVFTHASIHQPTNSVCLHYMYDNNDGAGPYLLLAQGPVNTVPDLEISPDQFVVNESHTVSIGGAQQADYVFGTGMVRSAAWACTDAAKYTGEEESNYGWVNLVLTWQADQQQFDLYTSFPFGKCLFDEAFSELDLLRLAENLTGVPTYSVDEFDPDCTQDIATLEELVGFDIKIPAEMPAGLTLRGASQVAPGVMLSYGFPGDNRGALFIDQTPITSTMDTDLLELVKIAWYTDRDFPTQGYEMLEVNGVPAVIILGSWVDDDGETDWYQEPFYIQTLWWVEDDFLFSINGIWSAQDGDAARTNLIAIAESMR